MGWLRCATSYDHGMTSDKTRRWWRVAAGLATTVVLTAVMAAPAAAWPQQYWISELQLGQAWAVTKGAGVTVAVVDTGVVDTLGDLRGQVLPGADFSGSHTDGRSDAGEDCNPTSGCYSHGTDMALTIAGTGAGAGDQGVAPQAKILPVKVQQRSGDPAAPGAIAQGIRWATDHGAKVINLSLGALGICPPVEAEAIKYAYQHDVIVVAAAGNEGQPSVSAPANCAGALAVTASDERFRPWSGTNYGAEVAFTGSGVNVPEESLNGTRLKPVSGTSGAAAIVSGTFALLRAHFPKMSARDIVTRALWNVHNGLGGTIFAQRVSDKLGYGKILPLHALRDPLPANAANPIYAHWAGIIGPAPGDPSAATQSASPSGTVPTSSPDPARASANPGIAAAGDGSSDKGSSTGVILGSVVGAVVVVAGRGGVLTRRSRRRPAGPGTPG